MRKLKEILNGNLNWIHITLILVSIASIVFVIAIAPSCLEENNGWVTILSLWGFPIAVLSFSSTIYYGENNCKDRQENDEEKVHNSDNGKRKKWYIILMCFFILAIVAFAVSLGFKLYEKKRMQVEQQQQQHFNQLVIDFRYFMQDSIGIENAYRKIAIGRNTLDHILEMLSLESSLSDTSYADFINFYNSRVDDAIRTINDAIDDPKNLQRREESKRELGPQKDSIERLRYIP